MKYQGLTAAQAEESRLKNGANTLTQIPPVPLWKKFLLGLKDPMIMILLVALAVQVLLMCLGQAEWFEPAGVLLAILIANGVSSVSECSQERKASALKSEEEAKEVTKLLRDGSLMECHVSEAVVGDLVFLQAGDKIPADGVVVDGSLKVDQAALNGETEEASKTPWTEGMTFDENDLLNPCYIYRGTVVCSGEAYMEIRVTGDRTLFGKLALEVQEETRKTPLQVKLTKLAKQISVFGYIGASVIVAGILLKTIFTGESPADLIGWVKLMVDAVTVAVTIIVCAVPEGLPLLTSILLSLQSLKMAKDNVLVRKINGLETAGSLSLLFTDKTGTITEGRLSVVELVTGNLKKYGSMPEIPAALTMELITGIGLNNSSMVSNGAVIGGNSTDRALMSFLAAGKVEHKINKDEVRNFEAFDSAKKYSKVMVERDGKTVVYLKGAPERILDCCEYYVEDDGSVHALADNKALFDYLNEQAGRSMRLLAVAKTDAANTDTPLTLICLLCIRDNVRKEAVEAIREVKNAGIQVVMITGDRIETASAIARDSGLLVQETDIAMTSADLAEKTDEELKQILPDLRVVARALPTDKSRLVRIAQEENRVVGMTGDGVNDSPALKKADVGFAMGSGTEVAKEAGDITILDDNFLSIEKAILYGRTMFQSIRKFLIFQLTVNVAAVLVCSIGPLLWTERIVMTVIQLLMINLAMDTLIAIAFGSEPALPVYMKEKPIPRSESIVNRKMFGSIILGSLYITCACLSIILFDPVKDLFGDVSNSYLKTALFATFMMSITMNGFNARTSSLNLFSGIGKNWNFLFVMAGIFFGQYLFITFGGKLFGVEPLTWSTWGICFVLSFLVIPLDLIRKTILLAVQKKG